MSWFDISLLVFALYYGGLMSLFAFGFFRTLKRKNIRSEPPLPSVTVVVAARNEEASIRRCLVSILANDYAAMEVVVVDDHSEDKTAEVVQALAREDKRLRLISLSNGDVPVLTGKGRAIYEAVRSSTAELILSTDADCEVDEQWVRRMAETFVEETQFVAGPVVYNFDRTWYTRLQALEFMGLIAVGAGGIGAGVPNMCNGANLAYRREMYLSRITGAMLKGAQPSDEALLQLLHAENPRYVRFCSDHEAVVRTDPVNSLPDFLRQRQRWASNGAHYPTPSLVAAIVGVYLFYALFFLAGIRVIISPATWLVFLIAALIKLLPEGVLLFTSTRYFKRRGLMRWFIPGQLIQVPYVVAIGAAGSLFDVSWKNRRVPPL